VGQEGGFVGVARVAAETMTEKLLGKALLPLEGFGRGEVGFANGQFGLPVTTVATEETGEVVHTTFVEGVAENFVAFF